MRTQQEINKAIDSFEQEVKAQLSLGLKPNEAVRNDESYITSRISQYFYSRVWG